MSNSTSSGKWSPTICQRPDVYGRRGGGVYVEACIPADKTLRDVSVGCLSGQGSGEKPEDYTLDDRSLWVDLQSAHCDLCQKDVLACSGHQGHLEFPEPCLMPQLKKQAQQALTLACKFCGAFLWETGVLVTTKKNPPAPVPPPAAVLSEAELTAARQSLAGALPFPAQQARELLLAQAPPSDPEAFRATLANCAFSVLQDLPAHASSLVLAPAGAALLSPAERAAAWDAHPRLSSWRTAAGRAFGAWRMGSVAQRHRRRVAAPPVPQCCLLVRVRQVLLHGARRALGERPALLDLARLVQQENVLHETLVQRLERLAYLGMTRRRPEGGFVRSVPPGEAAHVAAAPALEQQRQECHARRAVLVGALARLTEANRRAAPGDAEKGLAGKCLERDPRAAALPPDQWCALVLKTVVSATGLRKHCYLECAPRLGGCGGPQPVLRERGYTIAAEPRGPPLDESALGPLVPSNMYWRVLLASCALPWGGLGWPPGLPHAFRLCVLSVSRSLVPVVRATVDGRQALLNYGRDLLQQAGHLVELLRCAWDIRHQWEREVLGAGGRAAPAGALLAPELQAHDALAREYQQTLSSAGFCWRSTFTRSGEGALEEQLGHISRNLSELLGRKDGEFRKNGLGKRIDHSGRAVLTCNALVPLGHVVLGLDLLRSLRERVVVGPHNFDAMCDAVDSIQRARAALARQRERLQRTRAAQREGEVAALLEHSLDLQYNEVYPNLGRLWRRGQAPHETPCLLENLPGAYSSHLRLGDVLELSLTEGSKVVLNRQPTLSPQSLRVFTVLLPRASLYGGRGGGLVSQRYCIALNPIEEIPFNGDNDGDVLTVIALQDLACGWSSEETMGSLVLSTSRAAGENVVKLAQDNLAVLFYSLHTGERFRQEELLELFARLERHVPAPRGALVRLPPQPADAAEDWSCWDVLASFLPEGFVPPWTEPDGSGAEWRAAARWDKAWLGQHAGSLTKLLYADYGPEWAGFFLNCASVFVLWCNERHSTTVNLAELVHQNAWTTAAGGDGTPGLLPPPPPPAGAGGGGGGGALAVSWLPRERGLRAQQHELAGVEDAYRHHCASRTAELHAAAAENQRLWRRDGVRGLRNSVASGAKGSLDDMRQLELQTGLHLYEQALIVPSLRGRRSCYSRYDDAYDQGFVRNSFLSGLTVREYGWHMVSAREVVGRNVRTVATTGYFQHSLSFALQGIVYVPPGVLVRGGRDVVDVPGRLPDGGTLRAVPSALAAAWFAPPRPACAAHPYLHPCLRRPDAPPCSGCAALRERVLAALAPGELCPQERARLLRSGLLFEELVHQDADDPAGWRPSTTFSLPVLAERLRRAHPAAAAGPPAPAAAARALVARVLAYLYQVPGDAWCVQQAYVASELTAWRVAQVYRLSLQLLEILLKQVLYCYQVRRLPFGYSMGGVAASSYGHLGTQLTLNTRHKPSNTIRSTEGHPRILALTKLQSKPQDYLLRGRLRTPAQVAAWRAVDPARRAGVRVLDSGASAAEFRALLQRASPADLCVAFHTFADYHDALRGLALPGLELRQQDPDLDLQGLWRRRATAQRGRAPSTKRVKRGGRWSPVSREGVLVLFDDGACRAHGWARGGMDVAAQLRGCLPAFAVCSVWASAAAQRSCLLVRLCCRPGGPRRAGRPPATPARPPRFDTYQYNHTQLYCESLLRQALAALQQPALAVDAVDLHDGVLSLQLRPGRTTIAQVRRLLARPEWVPESLEITDPLVAYQALGVEACCTALVRELCRALKGLGELDYSHTQLLARAMTLRGLPLPINRSGYAQLEGDPFERALYEKNGRIWLHDTIGQTSGADSLYWNFVSGRLPAVGDAYYSLSRA